MFVSSRHVLLKYGYDIRKWQGFAVRFVKNETTSKNNESISTRHTPAHHILWTMSLTNTVWLHTPLSHYRNCSICSRFFCLLALVVGFFIDWLVRPLYPVAKSKRANCDKPVFTGSQSFHAIGVLLLQVMVSAVLVIYIRKLGELVPFIIQLCPDRYVPHWKVKEVEGELAIALMYVGIQTSIIDTLSTLRMSFGHSACNTDQ